MRLFLSKFYLLKTNLLPFWSIHQLCYEHNWIVTAGPFVMCTEEEARQAEMDYLQAVNGFEGAKEWNSFVVREDDLPPP